MNGFHAFKDKLLTIMASRYCRGEDAKGEAEGEASGSAEGGGPRGVRQRREGRGERVVRRVVQAWGNGRERRKKRNKRGRALEKIKEDGKAL